MISEIDKLGRFVIPKGIRIALGIEAGDQLYMELKGDNILMCKVRDRNNKIDLINELIAGAKDENTKEYLKEELEKLKMR